MLTTNASMRDYFRECLTHALKRQPVTLTDTAQVYVVNLLSEFSRSENVYAGLGAGERPTLAEFLARASDADPHEALRIYKHMGDSSLYHSGFFKESIERSGLDYYVSMGCSAYANVAGLMRPTAATSSALFSELADRFEALVRLLDAMSLHGAQHKHADDSKVLALVERYQRTGDKTVLNALKQSGIVLRPGIDSDDDLAN